MAPRPDDPQPMKPDRRESTKKGKENETASKEYGHQLDGGETKKYQPSNILKYVYLTLSLITIIVSIVVIVLALVSSIVTQSYTTDQSGRVVGMVVVIITAVVGLCMVITADVGVYKVGSKSVLVSSIVFLVLLIIQAVILGTVVKVTKSDERVLIRSLSDAFYRGKIQDSKLQKQWGNMESELQCCGFKGPKDYLGPYGQFPPDVPISCCPSYDSDKSILLQERERDKCRQMRDYYDIGCLGPFMNYFKDSSKVLLGVIGVYIVFEFILSMLGFIVYYRMLKLAPKEQTGNAQKQEKLEV